MWLSVFKNQPDYHKFVWWISGLLATSAIMNFRYRVMMTSLRQLSHPRGPERAAQTRLQWCGKWIHPQVSFPELGQHWLSVHNWYGQLDIIGAPSLGAELDCHWRFWIIWFFLNSIYSVNNFLQASWSSSRTFGQFMANVGFTRTRPKCLFSS